MAPRSSAKLRRLAARLRPGDCLYVSKAESLRLDMWKVIKVREDGYYWVRCDQDWIVAEWRDAYWTTMVDRGSAWDDVDFDKIDERRIVRDDSSDGYRMKPYKPAPLTTLDGETAERLWREVRDKGLASFDCITVNHYLTVVGDSAGEQFRVGLADDPVLTDLRKVLFDILLSDGRFLIRHNGHTVDTVDFTRLPKRRGYAPHA